MNITLTTRRCEIDQDTTSRAEARVARLVRFEPRLTSAELIFTEERHLKQVEGILTVDGNEPVVASGEGDAFSEALDQLLDRLDRILRKRRSQRRRHRGPGTKDLPQPDSA